jgi:hypothetical protein
LSQSRSGGRRLRRFGLSPGLKRQHDRRHDQHSGEVERRIDANPGECKSRDERAREAGERAGGVSIS